MMNLPRVGFDRWMLLLLRYCQGRCRSDVRLLLISELVGALLLPELARQAIPGHSLRNRFTPPMHSAPNPPPLDTCPTAAFNRRWRSQERIGRRPNRQRRFPRQRCRELRSVRQVIFDDEYYDHVIKYLDENTVASVWSFLCGLIRANPALKKVIDEQRWDDIDALLAIGVKWPGNRKGWYANIVTQRTLDEYLKMYLGQSVKTANRIQKHEKEIDEGSDASLHYAIASHPDRDSTFVVLGIWTEDADIHFSSAMMDLVEMYFSLLFQTLPKRILEHFLPEDWPLRIEIGLQTATPLKQSAGGDKSTLSIGGSIQLLRESSDPEVRKYASEKQLATLARTNAGLAAVGHRPISQALRHLSERFQKFCRDPQGTVEEQVMIECGTCQSKESRKLDPHPVYTIADGKYVTRQITCKTCPQKAPNAKGNVKSASTIWKPVDGREHIFMGMLK
ncbi:hypothetical protein MRB53_041099 [Persea americana]|nr:hypothetical protein MRB53_041099 [Persea americana]